MRKEVKDWMWQGFAWTGGAGVIAKEAFLLGWRETAIVMLLAAMILFYVAGVQQVEGRQAERQRDLLQDYWPDYYPDPGWDDE